MKPPKHINLNVWFRKFCTYERMKNPIGRRYHVFWMPHREWAVIWPFWSNTGDYPEREISLKQVIEDHWKAI